MLDDVDLLVVGAGFYGATVAERAAAAGKRILVIDQRPHVGGNAFSEIDPETGIERHWYGAHLFHTSNENVWRYIRRFTDFTGYRHRVYTVHQDQVFPMPINMQTICQFYQRRMSPGEARALIRNEAAETSMGPPTNLEEKAISLIGRPLYEAFIRGYTLKQWQVDPRDLPENIITRLPVRYNYDNRYFNDLYEGLPVDGYALIFERMLASPLIEVRLGVDFFAIRGQNTNLPKVVFTGPIDRFYDYQDGVLGWRTVDFEWDRPGVADYQGTSVMNYADDDPAWTRIIEFKHFHPERAYETDRTPIAKEYSRIASVRDEPYYPVNTDKDRQIYRRYRARAEQETNVRFGGRLGTYKYLDMHQAIGAALHDAEEIVSWLDERQVAA